MSAVTITGTADPAATVNYFHTGSTTPRPAERDASGNWVAPNVPMFPMSNDLVRIQFRIEQEGQAPSFQLSEFSVNKVVTPIGNDLNGSITNLPAGGADGSSAILTYDCENNLHCASNTVNGTLSLYWYDSAGRRIAKSENDLLTLYIWDGMDIIATANADGTIREYYTRGTGIAGDVGSLVAETRFTGGSSTTAYLHSNWRGDVVMATDESGAVIGEYSCTTFGEQLSATGTYTPRFTFSSKERDASGLVYFGFRYYSPVLCRWLSEDPIGEAGGINLYQFCGNDPVNGVDPYGEDVADYNWGWLYNTSDALAGFGDAISWGLTSWVREQMGYNDSTDPCSSSYKGGEIAGVAYDIVWGFRGAAGLGKNALKNSKSVGKGSKLFGRSRYMPKGVKSTFNSGDGIRTGWGWKKPINNDVFRTSWSQPGNRTYWNHIDWF